MPRSRRLPPAGPVFDTYWRFAAERQRIYFARVENLAPPWTDDDILTAHRFTNAYRVTDRVTQYLLRHVIYDREHDARDLTLRVLLFKMFNRIETWQLLERQVGDITASTFDPARFAVVLDDAMRAKQRIYSAAYIIPPVPGLAGPRKHHTHLGLLSRMLRDDLANAITGARSLREVYDSLLAYPGVGPFLAYQFAIDLNYSPALDHSEMEFVQAGPGAIDGIRKCFPTARPEDVAGIIHLVAEEQDEHFASRGIPFRSLWGRPLQLIDCQNLFCEISKYARVAHPHVHGSTGRTRIKQRFVSAGHLASPSFPPKWGLALAGGELRDGIERTHAPKSMPLAHAAG